MYIFEYDGTFGCSVKGGWSCHVIANSGIVQLFFERKVSYRRIAKVLAAEGLKVPKKTIWITISKYS